MSSRCESCDSPLEPHEMFRTVEVEDGKTVDIVDNTCNNCLHQYVYAADLLPTHEYQHQHITDHLWESNGEGTLGNDGSDW